MRYALRSMFLYVCDTFAAKVQKKSHICKHMQDFRSFFSHFLCIGVPRVNLKKCLGWHFELERHGNGLSESIELFIVCYGESAERLPIGLGRAASA